MHHCGHVYMYAFTAQELQLLHSTGVHCVHVGMRLYCAVNMVAYA